MTRIIFVLLATVCLLTAGCDADRSDKANRNTRPDLHEQQANEPTDEQQISANDIKLDLITDWPDDIGGCSCYAGSSQKAFDKGEHIYLDDYGEVAYIKADGQLQRFMLITEDTVSSREHRIEKWENDQYTMTVETKQTGQMEETWQHEGKIILKEKNSHKTTERTIYGECGC